MTQESQAHSDLQALLDAAVDAIIIIDHRGLIQAVNRSVERLFGHTAAECLGHNISLLMPPDMAAAHDAHISRYLVTGIAHVIGRGREVQGQRKDGSLFPGRLSVGQVAGSMPPRFVGFIHDLTQHREVEEEGRRSQARLAQVARFAAMGEMATGIAHELNQPLSAIATYAQACDRMLDGAEPDVPEIHAALKQIAFQALRAGEIIRKLRHMVANRETERTTCDINEVVTEITTLADTDARNNAVTLRFELADDLPPVSIDRVQVQQVLLNLLRNAIEALGDCAGAPRIITIGTHRLSDPEVEVFVRDQGPGVTREVADRMFDPFFTTKRTGTGLGLAISKTIARAHRGTLGHRPNLPTGAEFFLRLPTLEKNEL
jgi:two-component system sensor kinase FixL